MALRSEPRHSSGLNKYNVKAIRNEFDNFVRYHAWNKLRSKLVILQSNPELLETVILAKSKPSSGSLLHSLIQIPESPMDLIVSIATAAPITMTTQDSRLQTPLHIAIDRNHSAELIERILDLDDSENKTSLTMVDKQGDTPLLKASRLDASYLNLILPYAIHPSSVLARSKRKQRVALWYVASHELQSTNSASPDIPKDLILMLLTTYFALQKKRKQLVEEEEWDFLRGNFNDDDSESILLSSSTPENRFGIALVLRALIACAHLLGKYAVKILDFCIQRDFYREYIVSHAIDSNGNYILHQICMMDTTTTGDADAVAPTNAILLEQLLRLDMPYQAALRHPNDEGNLPLHLALASGKSYVNDLVTAYPAALQHPNCRGELPLHMALKLKSPNFSWLLVTDIWKAWPVAVEIQDGQSHLYPFQLAACSLARSTGGCVDDDMKVETQWLTLIYELLSSAPQVL